MNTLYSIGLFILGIGTGVALLRYGITLGTKIQKDEILEADSIIEQTHTGDEYEALSDTQ